MKKLLRMKFMLLLCALIVGSGTMWAETKSVDITPEQALNDGGVAPITIVCSKGDGTSAPAISSKQLRLYQAASGKTTGNSITFSSEKNITSIVFTFANGMTADNGVFSVGEYNSSTSTWSGSTNSVTLTCTGTTSGKRIYIDAMKVYYDDGSGSSLSDSDLALTDAPIALSFDLYNNSSAQTVSFTTSSTGEVTVSGGDGYVTTSVSSKTISVTPVAVTPANGVTITVSQAADDTYKAGSATFTITITDSTPIPTHTASFSVNGTVTTPLSYEEGADIIFPENPDDIDDYVFVGWITTSEYPTGSTPELITSATMGTTDITYYAVYAKVSQDGEPEEVLSQTLQYDTWTYNGTTTNKNSYRLFGDGSYVESASFDLSKLSKVKIFGGTFGGQDTYKTVTIGDGTNVWKEVEMTGTGNAKEHSFTEGTALTGNKPLRIISTCGNGSSSGIRMSKIEIYVLKPTISYSDHTTTVVADTREEAGLSFTESTKTVEWYDAAQYAGQALTNPNSVSPITWTSSNEEVATVEDGTVTIKALGETTIKASFDGDENYKKGEASYTLTVQDSRTALELSFNPESVEVNVNETVAIPTLNGNLGNGAVTYASDDANIATVTEDANTSLVVTGLAEGTTTITATVTATNEYKEGTATFTVTVIDPNKKGSVNNPYTVDEARAAIDAGTGVTEVYARGIVSEIVTAFNSQYGNITYNISEDGSTTSDQLQAYRGKSYNGDAFTSADDIQVGDVVVVYGDLKKYEDTYEFAQNNQLVSLKRARIIVEQTSYEADAKYTGTDDGYVSVTINFTHENVTMHGGNSQYASDFNAVVMCDANGNPTTYDWLKFMLFVPEDNVGFFYFNDNNGAPRTAYLKLHGVDADGLDVYSELITITQDGVAINVDETEIDASNIQSKNISVTYKNFTPGSDDFGVVYCDENGDELSGGYDWIEKITQWIDPQIEGTATMRFMFDSNTGSAPRTAYMKIYALNGSDYVYSNLITITQEVYVEPTKVSFYVNGGPIEYSYLEEGAPIVFPEVSNIDGMTFLGWTSNEINGTTDTAPEFVDVTSATMGTESINYYAVFALLVAPGTTSTVTDELTKALTGASGNSYSSWEGKKASSDAVYKGNSAGGNDAIQLRSNNNSGIVTTTSGGKLKKVTVEWNGYTADDRTLDIYGKNTAYSAASDLYGANTQGTKIGSIVYDGESTELTIKGDYTFIGLRSNNGAMYLDKITIEWETGTPDTYSDYCTTIPAMLTVSINELCTDGKGKYYGTFSSSSPFVVPANVTVSEIGIDAEGKMDVQNYASGAIVPANTGVMVSATSYGDFNLIKTTNNGESVLGDDNALRPSGDDGITADEMDGKDSGCKFYRLTMHNGEKIGFWWGAAEGAAFDVVANKAYLAVPKELAAAREGFAFDDDSTTGISNVNVNENVNGSVFDLQGRKVNKPGKGLYIVNGKKVVIK